MSAHSRLELLASRMHSLPFPSGSTDDRVSELHARLAEYDGYVAGLVERRVAGESLTQPVQRDNKLASELATVVSNGREPATSDARRLLRYLDAVDEVVNALLQDAT
jgi:hypothetical protein